MNVTACMIYWLSRLDSIVFIVTVFSIITGIATGISFSCFIEFIIEEEEEYARRAAMVVKCFGIPFVLFISAYLFVPSSKDMAAMLVIPRIVNSESVKELGDGVVALAKAWLEELKPNKEAAK